MDKKLKIRLYRRAHSDIYYMDYIDPQSGKRIRKSTNKSDYDSALLEVEKEQQIALGKTSKANVANVLSLYLNVETNPRFLQYKITGEHYTERHAYSVAKDVEDIISVLKKRLPKVLLKKMIDVTRQDGKLVREAIVSEFGLRRKSQQIFTTFKAVFTQARDDGIIINSPFLNLPSIKYDVKQTIALDIDFIDGIINAEHLFKKHSHWVYFTVLATTGMRRCEALALHTDQIVGSDLFIDRQILEAKNTLTLPKFGKKRTIPLPEITLNALKSMNVLKGRYFDFSKYFANEAFIDVKRVAQILYPNLIEVIDRVTPHVLRHSLNTALVIGNINTVLIQHWLGWEKQEGLQRLTNVQSGYTHIYTKDLQPIKVFIDKTFQMNTVLFEKQI